MLTSEDVDEVFDDVAFLEERFSDVQRLLLDDPAAGRENPLTLPATPCRLTVGPHVPGPFGPCFAVRLEPSPHAGAARVELLLADDGSLLGIADAGALDGWRTAIPSGLAARYLAPPAPRRLGLFGAGDPAWSCLLVLHHALPSLCEIEVVGHDPGTTRRFAAAAARRTGLTVRASQDAAATARRADIVTTTGGHPPVRSDWLSAGALLIDHTAAPPTPAVRHIGLAAGATPPAPLLLAEVVAGRALPRHAGRDIVHYRAGELAGWSALAAAAGFGEAWHRDVGTPMRLGRGIR
ncbi:hypothetical protein GCM10010377_02890 [Streptomyces viridiviolaceus]|uniref:Ornithine cyclodeaminase n=1 Tax=Streptomyces viridiviolaceus TaxID=68282 RepID=A0ABW2E095_9ACTN|nr:hypothetical protein [Streptomyces viridiviolaceus]GHB16604.1 hypothetical protein GCM10010377_02890 [Streptomyces viridiviolaceus]